MCFKGIMGASKQTKTLLSAPCSYTLTLCFAYQCICPYRSHAGCLINEENMEFAHHLLSTLGRGASTCAGLQEAAAACVAESGGHCSSLTRAIAKIGCSRRFPGNAERDLLRVLSLPVGSRLINMFFFKQTTNTKQIQPCCFKFVSWFVPSNFKVTFYGEV